MYFAIAFFSYFETKSPKGFFNVASQSKMRITAVFGGVTLGTGFAYFTTTGATLGLGALAGPAGVFLGYKLLADLEGRLTSIRSSGGDAVSLNYRNFASFFSYNSHFTKINRFYNLIRLTVFVGLIAFEIWLSSKYISAVFGFGAEGALVYASAVTLGLMAIGYTVIGGYPAALKTDYFQALMVLLLILYLLISGYLGLDASDGSSKIGILFHATPPLSWSWLFGTSAVLLTAMATQFYNVINTSSSRARTSDENSGNFWVVGIRQSAVILAIVFIGILFSPQSTDQNLVEFLGKQASGNTVFDSVFAAFILISLTSIIFTTVDSAIVSLSQVAGDIVGEDCDSTDDKMWPRVFCALIGLVAMPLALFLIHANVPIMNVVFAILTPLGALASYLVASIYVALKNNSYASRIDRDIASLFFIVFVSVFQLTNTFALPNEYVPIYTIVSFIPAALTVFYGLTLGSVDN